MAHAVAREGRWKERQVLVCSTGRIGVPLPIERIEGAIPKLVGGLETNQGAAFARAIMTTDTFAKEIAIEMSIAGPKVRIGGPAKRAATLHPTMTTMLLVLSPTLTL